MCKDYTKYVRCGHSHYTHVARVKGEQGTEGQNCLVIDANGWCDCAGYLGPSAKQDGACEVTMEVRNDS